MRFPAAFALGIIAQSRAEFSVLQFAIDASLERDSRRGPLRTRLRFIT